MTGNPNAYGVFGSNDDAAAGTGGAIRADGNANHGLVATSDSASRFAIKASNSAAGATAVEATADNGFAVHAISNVGTGVYATSNNSNGVRGDSGSGIAVFGTTLTGSAGVYGASNTGRGVQGSSSSGYGIHGSSGSNTGVLGESITGVGVYGYTANAEASAGYFEGLLTATTKNFRIDHPTDPAGKVLVHSCVESNERLTVYAGTVATDAEGEAVIELPAWFEALNRDLRYQLTVIGSFAQAMVKREVAGNRFTIATSEPGTKVSWQLTGARQDAYAKAHPLVVEAAKVGKEKGRYLHPVEHGQPESKGVDYELRQAMRRVPAA